TIKGLQLTHLRVQQCVFDVTSPIATIKGLQPGIVPTSTRVQNSYITNRHDQGSATRLIAHNTLCFPMLHHQRAHDQGSAAPTRTLLSANLATEFLQLLPP